MKVLLTGGCGFIGSHTAVELLNNNIDVVIVDNFSNSKPVVIDRIKQITKKEFSFYEVDICDYDNLIAVFEKEDIDAVVHFAGYKSVGESVEWPVKYYDNNINSTLTLLKVMEKYNVSKLVFSSSATVYGMNGQSPFKEDMPVGCSNPYGWTKMMIEQILKDVYVSNNNLSIVLLRYFNPVGAHNSGLIGEDPCGTPNNLFPYITKVALGKLPKLNIFGNDYDTIDGTGVRDYIHVEDLAKGHLAALNFLNTNPGVEIFNLGTGCGYSVLQIVNTFEKVNYTNVPYKFTTRRQGDIAICYSDSTKAKEVLKWQAEKTLSDMCKDSWNWQKNNPNGYVDL